MLFYCCRKKGNNPAVKVLFSQNTFRSDPMLKMNMWPVINSNHIMDSSWLKATLKGNGHREVFQCKGEHVK